MQVLLVRLEMQVGGFESGVAKLESSVGGLESGVAALESSVGRLEEPVAGHESGVGAADRRPRQGVSRLRRAEQLNARARPPP